MKLTIFNPKKSLNKAYLKEKVARLDIEKFKRNLGFMISKINENESEEHLKNIISDFLKDTWYKGVHEINTKERNDLVIHNGVSARESVGVIIETKRPSNRSEMISEIKANAKALHELILYYLRERIEHQNTDLKHLIVTNIYEWYILDENWFEKNVFRNLKLKRDYETWKLSGRDTKFFYDSIVKPFLDIVQDDISCTYFDIREFLRYTKYENNKGDSRLIPLYKILSPSHLLKQPFKNDSNSLDKKFYSELLYIIGLEEIKDGNKKIIKRKSDPDQASLLENTIRKLKDRESLRNLRDIYIFGDSENERYYNVALELCITWINRILFLKLLEAQLYNFNKGNKSYLFLNVEKIYDFDELSNLFFQVLSERPESRSLDFKLKYSKVPYLNSSLFERTELEMQTVDIGNLDNRLPFPLFHSTILKNLDGKRKTNTLNTLQYLFEFLDAYDFTSEGSEEIQEENKFLINSSVLGLIFEKINGYKDGSFFTPGFVTMHMCRETLRKMVIMRFNQYFKIDCETFKDLRNFLAVRFKENDISESNRIINSLRICDPAVGSGHFLVSALNEIIAIKDELGILVDEDGFRLTGYEVKVENDELLITYNDNSEIFEYAISNNFVNPLMQAVQKTIFHEKERIIENCLFGVDINSNSVKICRLRLWIELLKSTYYTKKSGFTELETLPNIDINIKCGNSLISRFELDDDLRSSFNEINGTLSDYKMAVTNYKVANDKVKKREIINIIEKIKSSFKISLDDKFRKKISKARGRIVNIETKINVNKQWKENAEQSLLEKLKKAKIDFKKVELERDNIISNIIYKNSFEWRFEFPEVLDDQQNFTGFDVIIGNPPYISMEEMSISERSFFKDKFPLFERKYETSVLFIAAAFDLLKSDGYLNFIAPVTWQTGENYQNFRQFLFTEKGVASILNLPFNIFEDAYVETAIYLFTKKNSFQYNIYSYPKKEVIDRLDDINFNIINTDLILAPKYKVILNPFVYNFLQKLSRKVKTLGDVTISTQGLSGSNFTPVNEENSKEDYPFLAKGNVYNYTLQIVEVFFTSLNGKPGLKRFYEAQPKLLIRRIVNRQDRLSVGYTDKKMVFKKDINPFIPTDPSIHPKYLLAVIASRLISFIYLNLSAIASKDDFRQTTLAELRELPIVILSPSSQQPFVVVADYILLLSAFEKDISFFERLVDAMVYELYLSEVVKRAGCEVLQYLQELPPIQEDNPGNSLRIVEKVYKELSDPRHPITGSLLKLLTTDEIMSIEGQKNEENHIYTN